MGNYYNYQIGIFFAILIGGLLILSLFIAAIYFGCVLTMRPEKKKRYSPPSTLRAAPPRQWQPSEPTNTPYTNLYATRATPTEYVPPHSPLVHSPQVVNQTQQESPMSPSRELGAEQTYRPEHQNQYYHERLVAAEPIQPPPHAWQTPQVSLPVTTVAGYSPNLAQSPPVPGFHTSSV